MYLTRLQSGSLASGGWKEMPEFSRRKKLGALKCSHERLPWAMGSRVASVKSQLELREHRAGTECSRKLKQLSNTDLGLEDRLLPVLWFPARVCRSRLSVSCGKTLGPLSGSRKHSHASSGQDGQSHLSGVLGFLTSVRGSWLPQNSQRVSTFLDGKVRTHCPQKLVMSNW